MKQSYVFWTVYSMAMITLIGATWILFPNVTGVACIILYGGLMFVAGMNYQRNEVTDTK